MIKVFYDDLGLINIETKEVVNEVKYQSELLVKSDSGYNCSHLDISKEHFINVNGLDFPLIMRGIVHTEWFEENFKFSGKLGSYIENGQTTFRVWAPTSHQAYVIVNDEKAEMVNIGKGVFEYRIDSNLEGAVYTFELKRYDEIVNLTDPYAKASLPNRQASVVIQDDKYKVTSDRFQASLKPILLEMSVRDFSMDETVPFVNRGKFLGLMESHGNYGFQHILDLGVTHVQLMPVNDFETVDELNPFDKYNWGYDTMQYMALEGSYSSNVHNPIQGILDLKEVINFYHNNNIGVNLDFVFNHVYEVETHPLHQSVPYYFFRYDGDYNLSNGSFCGNEIASEKAMMRKLIVESCKYFVEVFDIDGFRFDLMGLLDIETMNQVRKTVNSFGKSVMVYGEGWSMPTVLSKHLEASMANHDKMPGIAHFNDLFRDSLGGKVDGSTPGINFNSDNIDFLNSILNESYKILGDPKQSINYIECHDNYTLADRMSMSGKTIEDAAKLNEMVILSNGIPFIQIGQSFFRDKKREENSYNLPDSINSIKWQYLDIYASLNESMKQAIRLRNQSNDSLFQVKDGSERKLEN